MLFQQTFSNLWTSISKNMQPTRKENARQVEYILQFTLLLIKDVHILILPIKIANFISLASNVFLGKFIHLKAFFFLFLLLLLIMYLSFYVLHESTFITIHFAVVFNSLSIFIIIYFTTGIKFVKICIFLKFLLWILFLHSSILKHLKSKDFLVSF